MNRLNSFSYHVETSICVPAFRNLVRPLLVILRDDGMVVKAKPVLPHMDHHAQEFLLRISVSQSPSLPSPLSLSACQQPTGQAEMYCSLGHFLISSSTTWRGFFVSLLSASLSEDSCGLQQGQLEATDAVLKPPCWTTCLNTSPSSALVLSHTRLALSYQTSEWTHTVQCASFYSVYILLYELKLNTSLKLFRRLWLYIFWRYLLCIFFLKDNSKI